jgi:hypothetical protein
MANDRLLAAVLVVAPAPRLLGPIADRGVYLPKDYSVEAVAHLTCRVIENHTCARALSAK